MMNEDGLTLQLLHLRIMTLLLFLQRSDLQVFPPSDSCRMFIRIMTFFIKMFLSHSRSVNRLLEKMAASQEFMVVDLPERSRPSLKMSMLILIEKPWTRYLVKEPAPYL